VIGLAALALSIVWTPESADLLFVSRRSGNSEIYVKRGATIENLTNHPAGDNWPEWSPDGRRILFQSQRSGNLDIWVMNADGSDVRQLTDHPEPDYLPAWSPDGRTIVFTSWRNEGDSERTNHIYVMNADGTDERRLVAASLGTSAGATFSPDGTQIVYSRALSENGADIFVARNDGSGEKQLTEGGDVYHGSPVFSPDGSRIAFYADNGESSALVVMSSDGTHRRVIRSEGKNWYPRWSPDGNWLVYSAAVPGTEDDLDVLAIEAGGGEPVPIVAGESRDSEGRFSPQRDGEHEVVLETDVPATMRDGIVLRADVLRPDAPGRFPVLVIRTPYGKSLEWQDDTFPIRAARAGYVVIAQDVRGRYRSDGIFQPYQQEGKDGYDTVEWAASLPYSNGKVGMTGLSYPGAVQWLAAMERPPHLVTITPFMCFSTGRLFFFSGGAWDLSWIPWFYLNIAPDVRVKLGLPGPRTETEAGVLWERHGYEWLRFLPLSELPALRGVTPSYYDWLAHADDGPYWDFADVEARYGEIEIPALNLSGWHDEGYGANGALRNFVGTRKNGSQLVMGPWRHGTPQLTKTRVGDLDFGVNAGLDNDSLLLRWFDYWLRGKDNGLASEKPVKIFVMGEGRWREEDDWPLARRVETAYYLTSGGRLTTEAPEGDEPRRYQYDPADPVVDPRGGVQGPYDQSPHESRADVLVYETEPLSSDVEVTGHIAAELFVSSSAKDTDFVVRVLDVHPDGRAFNLMSPTVEVMRARYRNGESTPEPLAPSQVVSIRWRNLVTSNVFRAGHRIRLHVTSSFFPHFDRNPNTGEPIGSSARLEVARQEVHHGKTRPSRIVLPVIPR
jgi:hypothetical protein